MAIHGGAGAQKQLRKGAPFHGLAAERAHEIQTEMDANGPDMFIRGNAVGLQVVASLYYDAILKASQENDQDKIDRYVKTWGWLVSSALRAMLAVRQIDKRDDSKAIEAELAAYREQPKETE